MAGPTHVGYVVDETPAGSYEEHFVKPDINGVTLTTDHHYTEIFAYDGTNRVIYHGWALPGTATTGSFWKIKKLTYVGDNLINIQWADSNRKFDNAWDARTSQSYS